MMMWRDLNLYKKCPGFKINPPGIVASAFTERKIILLKHATDDIGTLFIIIIITVIIMRRLHFLINSHNIILGSVVSITLHQLSEMNIHCLMVLRCGAEQNTFIRLLKVTRHFLRYWKRRMRSEIYENFVEERIYADNFPYCKMYVSGFVENDNYWFSLRYERRTLPFVFVCLT